MKNKFLISSLAILAIIVSACASATPMSPTETMAPAMPATAMATSAMATSAPTMAMPSGPAAVDVGQNASLGSFLVDSNGMTLYLFTSDTPNTSTCTATCANNWPPLLTNGAPVGGTGVTASMLGTTTRSDGSTQVTYNGWPLYYFVADKAAGDTKGEGVKSVWYVVSPSGMSITTTPATSTPAASTSSNAAEVDVAQNSSLGSILVDAKGMTLYLYTKDTPNTSNCYSTCATYWPPLLTTGTPVAGTGVNASMLGTTARTDGTTQVTYNGWPLYYYASDKAAGDTTGENVQNVWFVITPDGTQK